MGRLHRACKLVAWAIDALGRVNTLLWVGGAALITWAAGWGVWAVDVMPVPLLLLFMVAVLLIALGVLGHTLPRVLPAAPSFPQTETPKDARSREVRQAIGFIEDELRQTAELIRDADDSSVPLALENLPSSMWINNRQTLMGEKKLQDLYPRMRAAYEKVGRLTRLREPASATNDALDSIDDALAASTEALERY